jgi:transposase
MPNHKSEDFKLSAVDYYLTEDKSQEEVCKIFKCSARSLMRWVDKYKKDGEIKRHNRMPVAYKIDKNEVKYILEEIKKNKTITMEDLLVKVKEKYPSFDISRRHLGRVIKDNNITLKITRVRHEPIVPFSQSKNKNMNMNMNIKMFFYIYI